MKNKKVKDLLLDKYYEPVRISIIIGKSDDGNCASIRTTHNNLRNILYTSDHHFDIEFCPFCGKKIGGKTKRIFK